MPPWTEQAGGQICLVQTAAPGVVRIHKAVMGNEVPHPGDADEFITEEIVVTQHESGGNKLHKSGMAVLCQHPPGWRPGRGERF